MENIWDFRKNQHCFSNAFVRILYVTVGYFYVVLPLFHRSVTPQTKRGTLSPEGARLLREAREKNKKRNKSCMNRQSRGCINKAKRTPKCPLCYIRAYVRTLLPLRAEHAEVGFVTAASVTNLTKRYPAFSGKTCIATERSPERRRKYRSSIAR